MRKDIKGCRIEVLCEALDKLGYEGTRLHTSYRKGPFHVKIREREEDHLPSTFTKIPSSIT